MFKRSFVIVVGTNKIFRSRVVNNVTRGYAFDCFLITKTKEDDNYKTFSCHDHINGENNVRCTRFNRTIWYKDKLGFVLVEETFNFKIVDIPMKTRYS